MGVDCNDFRDHFDTADVPKLSFSRHYPENVLFPTLSRKRRNALARIQHTEIRALVSSMVCRCSKKTKLVLLFFSKLFAVLNMSCLCFNTISGRPSKMHHIITDWWLSLSQGAAAMTCFPYTRVIEHRQSGNKPPRVQLFRLVYELRSQNVPRVRFTG